MSLKKYIQGQRKGEKINRLEKEAMRDLFLAEAMEGYDSTAGNQTGRIEAMRQKIRQRTRRRKNYTLRYWSIAASILLVLGLGGGAYFLLNRQFFNENKQLAQNMDVLDDVLTMTDDASDNTAKKMPDKEKMRTDARDELKTGYEVETITPAKSDSKPQPVIVAEKKINSEIRQNVAEAVSDREINTKSIPEAKPEMAEITEMAEIAEIPKVSVANEKVYGKVTDENGNLLCGATIQISNTTKAVISDTEGRFEIEADTNSIQISLLGFEPKTVKPEKNKEILIALEPNQDVLSEVTVVGFGRQKKTAIAPAKPRGSADSADFVEPLTDIHRFNKYVEKNRKNLSGDCAEVHGTVSLSFSTDKKGRPFDIVITKLLCPSADSEAIRLLKKGPAWKSAVKSRVSVDIKF